LPGIGSACSVPTASTGCSALTVDRPSFQTSPLTASGQLELSQKRHRRHRHIIMPVEVGSLVQLITGSWTGLVGTVSDIDERRLRASVRLDLFRRIVSVSVPVACLRQIGS
jgi:hypothetical protein